MALSPELSAKDLTSDRMHAMQQQLITLNERSRELADADPAAAEQVAKLSSNGLTHLRQAMLHLNMGLDPAKVQEAMDTAVEMYNEAVSIRKDLIHKKLRGITGPSGTMEDDFNRLQATIAPDAKKDDVRVVALGNLQKIAKDLDAEENNPFFTGFKNKEGKDRVTVNFGLVNKTRKEIAELRKAGINDPIFEKIETSMQFMEGVDPIRSSYNRMNLIADQMKGDFNWKPLRIAGYIGGAVVTAFGLGSALITGEMPSWPTALWAGLLVTSARPDLLASNEARAKQTLQKMEVPIFKNLLAVGKFSGEKGAEAFADIRELEKKGKFKGVEGLDEINNTQIALIAGEGSPLAERLQAFSTDAERASALKQFLEKIREGNGELVEDVIRIKPTLGI